MLIFICPALLDLVVFLVIFAVCYTAGQSGLSMVQCAWLSGIFQLTYMFTSFLIGLALNRRNARAWLLCGTVGSAISGSLCILGRGFGPLFAAMAVFGIFLAFFFNAFQTFMRGEAPPGGLARATGLYTMAWSLGSSLGFLLSGSLYQFGPVVLTGLTVLVGVLVVIMLLRHAHRPHEAPSADEIVEEGPTGSAPAHSSFVIVAWLMIFTAMFVQRPIQTFYPALSAQAGISAFFAGIPLFLHMFIQSLGGILMIRFRHWLYRRTPLLLVQGLGALILIGLQVKNSFLISSVGLSLLGLWAGFAYFSAVYYASNSGQRSRNIGINECLVGLGSFAGLFTCEWFMKYLGRSDVMYGVCAGALILSTLIQCLFAVRPRRSPAP